MKVVVTGGGGYVGYHVGWAIAQGGHEVILVDLTPPDPEWNSTAPKALFDALPKGFWNNDDKEGSLNYVKANILCFSSLQQIFQDATAVIHTASYGISGQEQLSAHMQQQEEVNIDGTRTVIMAAVSAKVQALVYTSTYNTVFGGQEIRNGNESLPRCPLFSQSDHYSRTKAIAEMLVLMANDKALPLEDSSVHQSLIHVPLPLSHASTSSNLTPTEPEDTLTEVSPSITNSGEDASTGERPLTLRTCSLRLNGVMGLGERRHSTRVIDALRSGFLCTYGKEENVVDFVGIQNAVQAHVRAMMALINEQSCHFSNMATGIAHSSKSPLAEQESVLATDENDLKEESVAETLPTATTCVSGNAFFISDESPINHFEYFRPWYEGLGYSFPKVRLPLMLIMVVAHVQQILYSLIHSVFPFKPFITPAEVYKSGVTHFFSCKKAKTFLGYRPTRSNDQRQMVEYYKKRGLTKSSNQHTLSNIFWFFLPLVIIIFLLLL